MVKTRIVPNYPALLSIGSEKNLIITDLHLGLEGNLSLNKVFVEKNVTVKKTIIEIEKLLKITKPDSLILLGDIKSGIKSITKTEWESIPMFFDKLKNRVNLILVPGNHDSNIEKLVPKEVNIASPKGIIIDEILFTHGHTLPTENYGNVSKIVMGHLHPVFFQKESIINGKRVWISIKCSKDEIFPSQTGDVELIIVPAFNKYFHMTKKKLYKKSISPIIEKINTAKAKIITLDGTIIGDEKLLPNLI